MVFFSSIKVIMNNNSIQETINDNLTFNNELSISNHEVSSISDHNELSSNLVNASDILDESGYSSLANCWLSRRAVQDLRTVLENSSDGIPASLFAKIYRNRFKYDLDLCEWGFRTSMDMFACLSCIFTLEPPNYEKNKEKFKEYASDYIVHDARKGLVFTKEDYYEKKKRQEQLKQVEDEIKANDIMIPNNIQFHFFELLFKQSNDLTFEQAIELYKLNYDLDIERRIKKLGFNYNKSFFKRLAQLIPIEVLDSDEVKCKGEDDINLWKMNLKKVKNYDILRMIAPQVPTGTVEIGKKFTSISIEDVLKVYKDNLIPVLITSFGNKKIKFMIDDSEHHDRLCHLMKNMEFYDKYMLKCDYLVPDEYVCKGFVCAAKIKYGFFEDWNRVEIIKVKKDGKIKVKEVDYGAKVNVERDCLRLLKHQYFLLKAQAISLPLYKITPLKKNFWKNKVKNQVYKMTKNQKIAACIMKVNQCEYEVILFKFEDNAAVMINEYLVEKGLAQWKPGDPLNIFQFNHLIDCFINQKEAQKFKRKTEYLSFATSTSEDDVQIVED